MLVQPEPGKHKKNSFGLWEARLRIPELKSWDHEITEPQVCLGLIGYVELLPWPLPPPNMVPLLSYCFCQKILNRVVQTSNLHVSTTWSLIELFISKLRCVQLTGLEFAKITDICVDKSSGQCLSCLYSQQLGGNGSCFLPHETVTSQLRYMCLFISSLTSLILPLLRQNLPWLVFFSS